VGIGQIAQNAQHEPRQIDQRVQQLAPPLCGLFRKADREVQKQRGLQFRGDDITRKDGDIEAV
jgi:hypothetical protein